MPKFNKVLIVEDDVFISELYARAIKKAGYDLELATTGPQGLELATTGEYDLMLLDIMIPEMTGVDVLESLRKKKDIVPNMKIVVTTNLEQDEVIRNAVESLADGYIIKADITPKLLVKMIHQVEESGELPKDAPET